MTNQPHPQDRPSPELRVEALETLLVERGLVKSEMLDGFIDRYANDVGPMNGARVVADRKSVV
jgi:nitrile hydratase